MNVDQFKEYIRETSKLLVSDNVISDTDCTVRASKFLEAQYKIAVAVRYLEDYKLKQRSITTATWAKTLIETDAKQNVTIRKALAEANQDYQKTNDELESIEVDIDYFKTMAKVFSDAHIFYRQRGARTE